MLRNSFDFGLANSMVLPGETEFIERMKSEYDIMVIETLYESNRYEDNIRIWIDMSRNVELSPFLATFYGAIKNNIRGISLNTECFEPEIRRVSQKIIDLYLFCLFARENSTKTNIYIYDFYNTVKEYAFGHSIRAIQNILYKKYQIEKRSVLCFYEPAVTIICECEGQFDKLLRVKNCIVQICYNEIKKHDHYGVIKIEDITVNILLKSELEKTKLNAYAIEQTLI